MNLPNDGDGVLGLVRTGGRGKVAVLSGAGISRDSGLPAVREFRELVLSKLATELRGSEKRGLSTIPFESLLETLSKFVEISELVRIYSFGSPCYAHYALTELFRRRRVDTLATTNIDQLFEQAFGVDFAKIVRLVSPLPGPQIEPDGRYFLKLHGSVEDLGTVMVTIRSIANRVATERTEQMLTHLFRDGQHKILVTVGYSWSDEFDINPFLRERVRGNDKIVLNLHHVAGLRVEEARIRPPPVPLDAGEAMTVDVDLRNFLSGWLETVDSPPQLGGTGPSGPQQSWEEIVHSWAGSPIVSAELRTLALARLDYDIGLYAEALQHHRELRGHLVSLRSRVMSLYDETNTLLALREFKLGGACAAELLAIVKEEIPLVGSIQNANQAELYTIGMYANAMAEYDLASATSGAEATGHFDSAKRALEEMRLAMLRWESEHYLIGYHLFRGLILRDGDSSRDAEQKDWGPAIREFQEASRIARMTGDAAQESDALYDLGVTQAAAGSASAAIASLSRSLRFSRHVLDYDQTSRTLAAIARALENQPEPSETQLLTAFLLLSRARDLCEALHRDLPLDYDRRLSQLAAKLGGKPTEEALAQRVVSITTNLGPDIAFAARQANLALEELSTSQERLGNSAEHTS